MDVRLEKFINFIVDNIIKNTKVHPTEEEGTYYLPFPSKPHPSLYLHTNFFSEPDSEIPYYFQDRLESIYGVRDEEVNIIWELYKERMIKQINN